MILESNIGKKTKEQVNMRLSFEPFLQTPALHKYTSIKDKRNNKVYEYISLVTHILCTFTYLQSPKL